MEGYLARGPNIAGKSSYHIELISILFISIYNQMAHTLIFHPSEISVPDVRK